MHMEAYRPAVGEGDTKAGDEELQQEAECCVGQPVVRLSPVLGTEILINLLG